MSILPEIVVAPLLVFMWFAPSWSNQMFRQLQRTVLRRPDPETLPRSIYWGWRLLVVALGVLWIVGLVRRFS